MRRFRGSFGASNGSWRSGAPAQRKSIRFETCLSVEALEERRLLTVAVSSSYIGMNVNAGLGFTPPDTCGAAGPTSYVETVNQALTIYTPKATGTTSVTDSFKDFWVTKGGLPRVSATAFLSDPIVVWDDQIQRFIVGDQDVDDTSHTSAFDLAVSKSASPSTLTAADWTFSQINTTEANHDADYPGNFGYNHDAFVFTLSQFAVPGSGATFHIQVNSVSITAAGTITSFQNDIDSDTLRPTVMHDSVAGDPMWLVAEGGGNSINVVKMTNVLSSAATFSTTHLSVNPYSDAVPPRQPDGTAITSSTDSRIMKAAEANGTIVASQGISVSGTEDDARWYAIDVSGATPTIKDQGNVSAGNNNYILYPGVDINATGDIGMTYMQSGIAAGQFMSMYVTGRIATDSAGTMQAAVLVQAGVANHTGGREGDLSGINVDSDGSFWATNEWAAPTAISSFPNWSTAIAHFTVTPTVTININDVTELEGDSGTTNFVFTVTTSGTVLQPVTVAFASADGTAVAPGDYAATSGTLTFQSGGSQSQTITINVVGDTVVEADETFFVNLSNATGAAIARSQAVGTILNDDITASINDITVIEGDSGTSNAVFTVSLDGRSHLPASLSFVTIDGTANGGSDYEPRGGTLVFPPLASSATITVPIIGDTFNEGTENFFVALSNPSAIKVITKAVGVCTIIDNDPLPALYVNDVQVTTTDLGMLAAVFTVALDNPSGRDVTVQYATADGTAHATVDYEAQGGVMTFGPGVRTQFVTVPISGSATYAPNEKFFLNLSNAQHASIADSQGVGTLVVAAPTAIEIIADDGDAGFASTAGWVNGTNLTAYQLDYDSHAAGNGSGWATWTFNNLATATYQVFARWIPFSNRASNAPYTILDGSASLGTVTVDQRVVPAGDLSNGITWQSLGMFHDASGKLVVRLNDNANGYVIADAIRIVAGGIAAQQPEMDVASADVSIGTGADAPSFDNGTDFGSVPTLSDFVTHTFTVTNTGNAALHLTGNPRVAVTGADPQDFTVVQQPDFTVAAGRTSTFKVTFDPTDVGLRQAIISIDNDDDSEHPYTFAVQGTGFLVGAVDTMGHNSVMPLDVNGDSQVSSLDALIVINRLNVTGVASPSATPQTSSFSAAPAAAPATADASYYVDVNGDGIVSPRDALMVINYLIGLGSQATSSPINAGPAAAPAVASAAPAASSTSAAPDALQAIAVDQAISEMTVADVSGLPSKKKK